MAYDVSNFISYMQRREGGKRADRMMRLYAIIFGGLIIAIPLKSILGTGYFRALTSYRYELYAIRDGVYYSHFRTG